MNEDRYRQIVQVDDPERVRGAEVDVTARAGGAVPPTRRSAPWRRSRAWSGCAPRDWPRWAGSGRDAARWPGWTSPRRSTPLLQAHAVTGRRRRVVRAAL